MKSFLATLALVSLLGLAHASSQKPASSNEQTVSQDSSKATYSAVISDFTPTTTATDIISLVGAAGKTINISKITVTGDASAAATVDIYLYKRTAPNTGGSLTQTSIVKHDSSDVSASAVVNQYSANPSALGTGILLRGDHISLPPSTTPGLPLMGVTWEFGNRAAKAPKLLNANESFDISWGGNAVPSGTNLYITIEWTEE